MYSGLGLFYIYGYGEIFLTIKCKTIVRVF